MSDEEGSRGEGVGQSKLEFRTADEVLREREAAGKIAEEISNMLEEMSFIRSELARVESELESRLGELESQVRKLWEVVSKIDSAVTELYARREAKRRRAQAKGRFPEPITDRQTAYIEDMVGRISELTGRSHEEILEEACRMAKVEVPPGNVLENLTKRDASKIIDAISLVML